jgi:hypothetical protein
MQSDSEGKPANRATVARRGCFAPSCQTFAERDPSSRRQGRSTLHGVVFAFFVPRISVMEPNGGCCDLHMTRGETCEAAMAEHWKHTADPAEIMRANGHPELEYAAGWTIAGLVTIGTIVAAWVFAI